MQLRLWAVAAPALCSLPIALSAQCELQALRGVNTLPLDFFGKSASIDGTTIVVGAFAGATSRTGSAHVFELSGGDWVQTARLVPSDGGASDQFGNSVGISGSTLVVGSEFHDGAAGNNSGAAYVFEKVAGAWVQTGLLEPHDPAQSKNFGECVAISGNVIAVGDRFDSQLGNNAGAAYVFERSGGTWPETAKLLAGDGKRNDLSGDTVAVDGLRVVMGSYRSDASASKSGAAYVFEKVKGQWLQSAKLVASDRAGELGRGVAVDGDRIVLGARRESTLGTDAGAGYVFELANGAWKQSAKLVPAEARAGDWVGESVAVSGDALVLSGHFHDLYGSNSGVGFVFERVNGSWVERPPLVSSAPSPDDAFSFACAMWGNLAVLTSPFEAGNVGGAYVFSFDQALCGCGGTGGGSALAYGTNLGGANIGSLTTADVPDPGTTVHFVVSDIPAGSSGFVFLSTRQMNQAAFGGTLLAQLSGAPIKLPFGMSHGQGSVNWRVAYDLCGQVLFAQAVVLDPTQALGRALTNGLKFVIGR